MYFIQQYSTHAFSLFVAFIWVLITAPTVRAIAVKIGLTDQPNPRKVHRQPVPLVGGILIFCATLFSLLIQVAAVHEGNAMYVFFAGSLMMLVTGVIDDRLDVRASYKLVIQIALAWFVYSSGIRIESLYGLMGIDTIPTYAQGVLTMIVIVGVVNAFNLTDGIDGLAGGLAFLGLVTYCFLSVYLGKNELLTFFCALIGAIIGFLRYNFSRTQKIFMGDAGSLVLGFILVVSGIILLQASEGTAYVSTTVATVSGVLALPVIDSLRVYRGRIKAGHSPFRADRTHFHHLVLSLGVKHKTATTLILGIALCILVIAFILGSLFSFTCTIISLLLFFALTTSILQLNMAVTTWRQKIKELEEC
jgi:UDP-GlcNAc:undecaprenyl-phosphate/decaprenyl-phosphate GlcNAc-1-phosphate transferase